MNPLTPEQTFVHLQRMEKAQAVRLFDVFVLGPAMIYIGTQNRFSKPLDAMLLLSGIGTIIFNGYNYLQIRRMKDG